MSVILTINWKRLTPVFVPGVLIAATSIYVLDFHAPPSPDLRVLPDKALTAYDDFYLIHTDDTGALYLGRGLFMKTINYLPQHPSPRAVADSVYLGNSNNVTLLLSGPTKAKYLMLTQQPDYVALSEVDRGKSRVFRPYADIVNGIGRTFADAPVKIVLHDTRSPLRSIVAVQGPTSNRKLGDTNANFDIQLIKNRSYGEGWGQGHSASFVSYDLTLRDGRAVKPITIPIFHDVYGLIGFICIDVDIPKMDKEHPEYTEHFADIFEATIANDAINEMIQSDKRKN